MRIRINSYQAAMFQNIIKIVLFSSILLYLYSSCTTPTNCCTIASGYSRFFYISNTDGNLFYSFCWECRKVMGKEKPKLSLRLFLFSKCKWFLQVCYLLPFRFCILSSSFFWIFCCFNSFKSLVGALRLFVFAMIVYIWIVAAIANLTRAIICH